ncbi:MAG: LapA family protein [Ostreibacterium sp.]
MKKFLFIVLAIIAILVILPLSFSNADTVTVNYLLGHLQAPLSWLMLGSFIFGVLIALPFFALTGWGWKIRARSLQKQMDKLITQSKQDDITKQFESEKKS